MSVNSEIFKAYDVRGTYPDQVNEEAARAIGSAFVANGVDLERLSEFLN